MTHDHVAPKDLPPWIAAPFLVCSRRLDDESRYLHQALRGLAYLRAVPDLLRALYGTESAVDIDVPGWMKAAESDAGWVDQEAAGGFPLLHAHAVVGIWSAVEVLAEDFAVAWLANVPAAWEKAEVKKLKLPISKLRQTAPSDYPGVVVAELSRGFPGEVRRGVGQIKALLGVFDLWPSVGPNVQKGLHELCQVRNALVHCGGRADQKFLDECPWFSLSVGEPIGIPHALYGWYIKAASRLVERVLNQGITVLGFAGCECPEMDEVSDRPLPESPAVPPDTDPVVPGC